MPDTLDHGRLIEPWWKRRCRGAIHRGSGSKKQALWDQGFELYTIGTGLSYSRQEGHWFSLPQLCPKRPDPEKLQNCSNDSIFSPVTHLRRSSGDSTEKQDMVGSLTGRRKVSINVDMDFRCREIIWQLFRNSLTGPTFWPVNSWLRKVIQTENPSWMLNSVEGR